jgi:hypothetical protein
MRFITGQELAVGSVQQRDGQPGLFMVSPLLQSVGLNRRVFVGG